MALCEQRQDRKQVTSYESIRMNQDGRLGGHWHGSHATARLGAAATALGALLHHRVGTEALTVDCALLTNFGADATDLRVKSGVAQHEVGARLTDFGAIKQHPDMGRLRMVAAHFKTMTHSLETDAVTVQTVVNTLLHFLTLVIRVMCHRCYAPFGVL